MVFGTSSATPLAAGAAAVGVTVALAVLLDRSGSFAPEAVMAAALVMSPSLSAVAVIFRVAEAEAEAASVPTVQMPEEESYDPLLLSLA